MQNGCKMFWIEQNLIGHCQSQYPYVHFVQYRHVVIAGRGGDGREELIRRLQTVDFSSNTKYTYKNR